MLPPKYNFYCGKALKFYLTQNLDINTATGEYVSDDFAMHSNQVPVASNYVFVNSKSIYINYSPSNDIAEGNSYDYAETLTLYMYDINSVYLGCTTIHTARKYTLIEGTTQIAIRFIGRSAPIKKKHSGLVQNGFSDIYALEPVSPHYKTLTKKYKKENNQMFFRATIGDTVNLYGSDYNLVHNYSLEDRLIFFIEKFSTINSSWEEYYKGTFNKTDCTFDYMKKSCSFKLTALDSYNKVLDAYKNTYDIIRQAPALSQIDLYKRPLIQVYIAGADKITGLIGGTSFETDVNSAVDSDKELTEKYHFNAGPIFSEFSVIFTENDYPDLIEASGVYSGYGDGIWYGPKGYYCRATKVPNSGSNDWYAIGLYDNTDAIQVSTGYHNLHKEREYLYFDEKITYAFGDLSMAVPHVIFKNVIVYKIYARLLCDLPKLEKEELFRLSVDDLGSNNRNYKYCKGLSNIGNFYISSVTQDGPTRFGIDDFGKYFTDKIGIQNKNRILPIIQSYWGNASIWYEYPRAYQNWEASLRKKYTLKHVYSIAAVISVMLNAIDPSLRHEATAEYSEFLYADVSPVENVARHYVYLAPITNILKGAYDQPALKAEITFEELMSMLRDCFQCYWFIENNKFRIEHISYFINGGSYIPRNNVQLDLTKKQDAFNFKPYEYFQSSYNYSKDDLPGRIELNWPNSCTEVFGPVNLDMKSNYVKKDKTDSIEPAKFSSDVDLMLLSPGDFSEDGLALLCPIKKGNTLELPVVEVEGLIDESKNTYTAVIQNYYASWVYLQDLYRYNASCWFIESSALGQIQAYSRIRALKQQVKVPSAEDPQILSLIRTSLGDGVIDEISIDLTTRVTTISLRHSLK